MFVLNIIFVLSAACLMRVLTTFVHSFLFFDESSGTKAYHDNKRVQRSLVK